jgi:hypothetical protein
MSTDQAFNDLIKEAATQDPDILELGSKVTETWGQVMSTPEELEQHLLRSDRSEAITNDREVLWVRPAPVGPEIKPELFYMRGIWRPRWVIFALFPASLLGLLGLIAHFIARAPVVGTGGSAHAFAYMAGLCIFGLGLGVDMIRLLNSRRYRPAFKP